MSNHCDIIRLCHNHLPYFSVGKALCQCRGNAMICLCICQHPCQMFTTTTATHELYHLFHIPNSEPVTLICLSGSSVFTVGSLHILVLRSQTSHHVMYGSTGVIAEILSYSYITLMCTVFTYLIYFYYICLGIITFIICSNFCFLLYV